MKMLILRLCLVAFSFAYLAGCGGNDCFIFSDPGLCGKESASGLFGNGLPAPADTN